MQRNVGAWCFVLRVKEKAKHGPSPSDSPRLETRNEGGGGQTADSKSILITPKRYGITKQGDGSSSRGLAVLLWLGNSVRPGPSPLTVDDLAQHERAEPCRVVREGGEALFIIIISRYYYSDLQRWF